MNLDELSKVFIDLNIVDTACHANEEIFRLSGMKMNYYNGRYVQIDSIKIEGKTLYRIGAGKSY